MIEVRSLHDLVEENKVIVFNLVFMSFIGNE